MADALDLGRRRGDSDLPNVATMATTHTPPRVEIIDALRGFALLGIVLVNVGYFASAWHGLGVPDPAAQGPIDGALTFLVKTLAETKFYLLFSLLFGYSFTIQMESARRSGRALAAAFSRRLLALFVLGAGHAVLLFNGDILGTYAVMGAVLLSGGARGAVAQPHRSRGFAAAPQTSSTRASPCCPTPFRRCCCHSRRRPRSHCSCSVSPPESCGFCTTRPTIGCSGGGFASAAC